MDPIFATSIVRKNRLIDIEKTCQNHQLRFISLIGKLVIEYNEEIQLSTFAFRTIQGKCF